MKNRTLILLIISIQFFSLKVFASYSIQRFDYDWCTSSYPTGYTMGSFSISETDISGTNGFTKGQTSKTLQIDLSSGIQFKTSGGSASITSSSSEVIIDSFSFPSVTRLLVTITTSSVNSNYDVIYFNDFEISAQTTNVNGVMGRSGGTFLIDNKTTNPTVTQYFGVYTSKTPFSYTSSAVDQPTLTDIGQYTINNPILRIKITGTGSCSGPVTQFNFSTNGNNGTGTDSIRNITRAKIFYTGNTTTFNTSTYFGQYDLPNGNFTISGNIGLIADDNYFWLCYDVPGDANTNALCNNLDASLISFVLQGGLTDNMATPSPVGYRQVVPSDFYYSRASGNWTANDIWATTDDGPTCNCQPNGAGIVVIDTGHVVNMNKTRIVDVTWIMDGGSLEGANAAIKFITNNNLTTSGSGFFYFLGDMNVKGNVTLNGTGVSEFHKIDTIGGDLYIASGATYANMASSTYDLMVGGNITIDGHLQNTQANVVMYGGNTDIDGYGTIQTSNFIIKNGNKTVKASADLYIDAGFQIQGPYTLDNFGKMNIRGNMNGNDGSAQWINETGSDLSYGGSAIPFATYGILDTRADSNMVRYSGTSDQNIGISKDAIYYDLALEGSNTKYMIADTHLHGDLYFNAAFGNGTNTVTVDGARMQYFTGTVKPTMYHLIMANSANGLTLQLPVDYSGELSLSSGKVFTDMTNILTAKDNASSTSGSLISFVNGPMQKIGNDVFVFPLGKNSRWARIGITAPLTTTSSFTAEYFDSKYTNITSVTAPIDHVSAQEYWSLLNTAKLNDPVNVKLYWEDASWSGIEDYSSDLVVGGWNGSSWVDRNQSAITGSDPGNLTSGTVTSFGPVTYGSKNTTNPLFISLLSFDAKCSNNTIIANWSTAVETNNEYFTLEKSIDAEIWNIVDKIDGAGNSNKVLNYQYVDENSIGILSYYRLIQTDFDGNYEIFGPVSVICSSGDSISINIYPNPFNSELIIQYSNFNKNKAVINVFDLLGDIVCNKNIDEFQGTIDYNLDLHNLKNGIYFVEIYSDNMVYHQKVIKH